MKRNQQKEKYLCFGCLSRQGGQITRSFECFWNGISDRAWDWWDTLPQLCFNSLNFCVDECASRSVELSAENHFVWYNPQRNSLACCCGTIQALLSSSKGLSVVDVVWCRTYSAKGKRRLSKVFSDLSSKKTSCPGALDFDIPSLALIALSSSKAGQ